MQRGWPLILTLLLLAGCSPKEKESSKSVSPKSTVSQPTLPPATTADVKTEQPVSAFASVTAQVEPYSVSESLAEVANLRAFTKAVPISPEQKRLLAQNLFVCTPTNYQQLFHIYENNDYLSIPSFVTTDAVLQLYHIFYDFTLRSVETEFLTPALIKLTNGMIAESQSTWQEASDPKIKQAALKNVAFFGVAARALGLKVSLPPEAASMAQKEMQLIAAHKGFALGAIFPYKVDYSQFVPRGHYTRSETLKRFFIAMLWYGMAPFALRYRGDSVWMRADEPIRQGLLLTRSLYRAKLDDEWEAIYEPTRFFVGAADDLTPAEWKKASDAVYGADAPLAAFAEDAKLDAFVEVVRKLRAPRIQPQFILERPIPDPSLQLRLMGQRYIPDSEVLQRLTAPITRPFPSGLDVMAVLGSQRAQQLLDDYASLYNPNNWAGYKPEREKLVRQFAEVSPTTWTSNLYWNWLYTLKALLEPLPEGFPSFMRTDAWLDKSIHTALGSWAELRHDTILYGKQSGAECGDGEEPPKVKGYVEPNVVFYDRLLALTKQTREGLAKRKFLSDKLKDRFEQFEDLLSFLKTVSEKELRNQKLEDNEYDKIRYIGGELEYMTLSVMEGNANEWELVSETDKNMAVIADVHTALPKVLEVGVGHAYEILVIVPVEGKMTLTRGAVFSYYEFTHPMSDRLTDEKWQAMLKAGRAPIPPPWVKTFFAPVERKMDKNLSVYSSGC